MKFPWITGVLLCFIGACSEPVPSSTSPVPDADSGSAEPQGPVDAATVGESQGDSVLSQAEADGESPQKQEDSGASPEDDAGVQDVSLPDTAPDALSDIQDTALNEDVEVDGLAERDSEDIEAPSDADEEQETLGPVALCGNGVIDPAEACDDGNQNDGDWCSSDCTGLVDVSAEASFEAHRSVETLTSSNGLTAITWKGGKIDRWMESPYHAYGPEQTTLDYLFDHFFGVRLGDNSVWLTELEASEFSLVPGTSVIRVVHQVDGVVVTQWWWTPFSDPSADMSHHRIVVGVLKLEGANLSESVTDVASLWNVHGGGEGQFDNEVFQRDSATGIWTETSGKAVLAYANLVEADSSWTMGSGGSPENPWVRFKGGQPFENNVPESPLNDGVLGFSNSLLATDGGEVWLGTAALMQRNGDGEQAVSSLAGWIEGRSPKNLLQAELDWWDAWHEKSQWPEGLSDEERLVARQSTAVLKMSQVRETPSTDCPSNQCFGQILASLIPGKWNISWVRDAAYAIAGLVRVGHLDEARWGLEFMLNASPVPAENGGNWIQQTYIESTDSTPGIWGLGVTLPSDYLISVARYFGQGLEESDENSAGPNIEWDNWGLFLWAYAEVAGKDPAWAEGHLDVVVERVVHPLMALTSDELGLLLPDSSIWERHWCPHGEGPEPETRKHHAYSSIMAAAGLRAMAQTFENHPEREVWLEAADGWVAAIRTHLVQVVPDTGQPALAGNLEEMPYETYYLDLSVVEAINFGLVHPGELLSFGTFAAFDSHLRMGDHSPGYRRTDDPTWYDAQEWVVMDLRAASALHLMGQQGRVNTLANWITDQAMENHGLIAELLSDGTYQAGSEDELFSPGMDTGGDYQGAIPMCGFGPGAYLLMLDTVYGK